MEALVPAKRGTMGDDELLAAYRDWCAAQPIPSLEAGEFMSAFASLAEALGLPREAGRYRGIAATVETHRQAA